MREASVGAFHTVFIASQLEGHSFVADRLRVGTGRALDLDLGNVEKAGRASY